MIRSYFNLKDLPFSKELSPELLFKDSAVFAEGIKRLEYIRNTRGIMLLTGDPGVGKTNLLRYFVDSLNSSYYKTFYLPLSTVNILDFYRQLNFALTGEYLHRKANLFSNIQTSIQQFVQHRKIIPVIIFDEAHFLKNENFSELQIISNFEMDSVNPAIFIIAGQSHLRDRLNREIHAAFHQRITLRYHLTPLPKPELINYIDYSLSIVGAKNSLVTSAAKDALFNNSQGNMRVAGKLVTMALTAAAIANKTSVSEEEIFLAAKECEA